MKRPAAAVRKRPAANVPKRCKLPTLDELPPDQPTNGAAIISQSDCDWLRTHWPKLSNFKAYGTAIYKYVQGLMANGFRHETKAMVSKNSDVDERTCDNTAKVTAHLLMVFDKDIRSRAEYGTAMQEAEDKLQYLDIDGADETPFPTARTDDLSDDQKQLMEHGGDEQ